jgi:hypothetical protein
MPLNLRVGLHRSGRRCGQRSQSSDDLLAVWRQEVSDEEVFELTYVSAKFLQHATVTRALRLESDDRPSPVAEVRSPRSGRRRNAMSSTTWLSDRSPTPAPSSA